MKKNEKNEEKKWKKWKKTKIKSISPMHYPIIALIMGHTAWAPEGREGRYQAGPKGPKPARRAAA